MAVRRRPTGRVKLRDRQTRYTRAFRGYGIYDILADHVGKMEEYIPGGGAAYDGLIPSWWYVDGKRVEPAIQFVPGSVNCMMVTPWTDNSQRLDLTAFDIEGDSPNHWCDWVRDSEGHAINFMFNAQPPLTQGTVGYTSLLSRFALPRNPMFAVRLIRFDPADSVTDAARRQLATTISFGILTQDLQDETGETKGAEVRLVMPFGTPPQLWWRHDTHTGNEWEPMLGRPQGLRWGSLGGAPRGMANAESATIWIACLRSGVAVSTDRFREDLFYQRFPIIESGQDVGKMWAGQFVDGWTPDVPAGFVRIGNNAGFWGCSFIPLLAGDGDDATLYGPLHEVGYEDPGFLAEEKILQARTRRKTQPSAVASDAYVQVEDVSGTPNARRALTDATKQREWRATFVETQWSHTFTRAGQQVPMQRYSDTGSATFTCHVSPELYAVSMAELPTVEGSGSVGDVEVGTLMALGYSAGPDTSVAEAQCVLDNRLAEHREMRIQGAREATVELGYELSDDTTEYTQVLTGIISDPQAVEDPLSIPTVLPHCPDFGALLSRNAADGTLPTFDGWPVWRVLQFILRRAGFADAEMGIVIDASDHYSVDMSDVTKGIEDTGTYLSMGPPERPIWQVARGRALYEFIRGVARFDNLAGFWFHPDGTFTKGCRYCRRRRDGSDPNGTHHPQRHQGPNSTGCQAYDVVRAGNAQGVDIELYSTPAELISSGVTLLGPEILSMSVQNMRHDGRRFANRIEVTTTDRTSPNRSSDGASPDPISSVVEDLASIEDPLAANYAHGEIFKVILDETLVSQGQANALALDELAQLSHTQEYIELELPLNPGIAKGSVFRTRTGDDIPLDVNNHVYRTQYVEHELLPANPIESRTRIGGIFLRLEVPT